MAAEADQGEVDENLGEEEYEEDEEIDGSQFFPSEGVRNGEFYEDEELSAPEEELSRIGTSSDDPEQKRLYLEYLALVKEIHSQNDVIKGIKAQIMDMCAKPCKTRCEIKDIKRLRGCMEQENIKLHCLMNQAMKLQNFGSKRRYPSITLATTIDEDNMSPYLSCIRPQSMNWKGETSEAEKSSQENDNDKALRALCGAMGKMKVSCPKDKKLLQEIAAFLCKMQKKKQSPCRHKRSHAPPPCDYKQGQASQSRDHKQKQPQSAQQQEGSQPPSESLLNKLKQKICSMQAAINKINQEIRSREQQGNEAECQGGDQPQASNDDFDAVDRCQAKRTSKNDEIAKLKENYVYLLSEFSRKETQLKDMEKRAKGFCGGCGGAGGSGAGGGKGGRNKDAEQSELELLRARVGELKEEQVEFKCIMKEQSQQLEDYRKKYLVAQQQVEEQVVTLEKLNLNNKRIEKQINTEVKEIRAKFQEKINELLHFPKLLENEQLKLAESCREKDELEGKLSLICKELQSLKQQMDATKDTTDCRPQLVKCELELAQKSTKVEELERQRDMFCEKLKSTQDDLDTLRSESVKIIVRTKERAELMKTQQQEQIDRLEKELAQCRASASISVKDRETVIREMQGQLNTLSYSFDAAQKQIKTLRNHIAYVSNENCFPVKC